MSRRVPKCAECGAECYFLGYKVEIPKKSDVRGWRSLRLETRRRHLARAESQAVTRVRVAHAAERRIVRLQSLGANREREKIIAQLREKIHA